jgi:hypothetical protein
MHPVKAPIPLAFGTVVLLAGLDIGPAMAQNNKNDCKHPPKILSQPKFSDEDRSKWKGKSVTGRVSAQRREAGEIRAPARMRRPKDGGRL